MSGRALLDVNVLLALLDPLHINHDQAQDWFGGSGRAWASCPITQNGYIRIASQPRYPNPCSTGEAVALLADLTAHPGHRFWPDALSLLDPAHCDSSKLHTARYVTDTYLLALAKANGGQLATLDARLSTSAVERGGDHLVVIGQDGGE